LSLSLSTAVTRSGALNEPIGGLSFGFKPAQGTQP
jgi:hypothetical protein